MQKAIMRFKLFAMLLSKLIKLVTVCIVNKICTKFIKKCSKKKKTIKTINVCKSYHTINTKIFKNLFCQNKKHLKKNNGVKSLVSNYLTIILYK